MTPHVVDALAKGCALVIACVFFGAVTMAALGRPNRRARQREERRQVARDRALTRIRDYSSGKDAA